MISRILSIIVFTLIIPYGSAFSQDVDGSIAAFNEAIGKEYNVNHKGKILIIEGFREGKQVKVDKVNVFDLDLSTIKFSSQDNSVSLKCYSDLEGCVERVLLLNAKKSYKPRVVFGLADGVSGDEILSKFELVINEMVKKY